MSSLTDKYENSYAYSDLICIVFCVDYSQLVFHATSEYLPKMRYFSVTTISFLVAFKASIFEYFTVLWMKLHRFCVMFAFQKEIHLENPYENF